MTKQFREAQIEFYLHYLLKTNHYSYILQSVLHTKILKRAKRELSRPINEGEK